MPSDGPAPSCFDPAREHSSGNVGLFWLPPPIFLPWAPSAFIVDDVPDSCAEQNLMVEKAYLLHDHRALDLNLCSSEPHLHKRIGGSVRGFDYIIWELEREKGRWPSFSQTRW